MRATFADVRRNPSWLPAWWEAWPPRSRRFWQVLLFEKGQGWLRWGMEERQASELMCYAGDEPLYEWFPFTVAPPLRRAWLWLCMWANAPRAVWNCMIVGIEFDGRRERLSWEETKPWDLSYVDPERREELWGR